MQAASGHEYLERADVTNPRTIDPLEYEHRARYVWAADSLQGSDLLDVACGTGHGSEVLAAKGHVTGIDVAPEAVARAKERVEGTFIQSSVPPLPLADSVFDTVVSFETIEHINQDAELVREFARVLRPGGQLFLSSPNSAVSSPDGEVGNPFHLREYTLDQLRDLVTENGFERVEVFAQGRLVANGRQRIVRSALWRTRFLATVFEPYRRFLFVRILDRAVTPATNQDRPEFWLLKARAAP